jgi:hypothetical protein
VDAYKAKEAADGMVRIAKQFSATDAAFAAEIERVAQRFQREAAEAAAQAEMSEVEAEAVAEQPKAYDVYVEGVKVGTVKNPEEAVALGRDKSTPGDRIEILFGGEPTRLFVRSASGIHLIPKEMEADVKSMTPAELKAKMAEAEQAASERVAETPPASEAGIPWWVYAAGGAALIL